MGKELSWTSFSHASRTRDRSRSERALRVMASLRECCEPRCGVANYPTRPRHARRLAELPHACAAGTTALAAAFDYLPHALRSRHSPHAVSFDSTPNSSSCIMHVDVQVSAVNMAQRSHEATGGALIAIHLQYAPQYHAWSRETGAAGPSGDAIHWAATRLMEQIYVCGHSDQGCRSPDFPRVDAPA